MVASHTELTEIGNALCKRLDDNIVLGLGTGVSVEHFIDCLHASGKAERMQNLIASSKRTQHYCLQRNLDVHLLPEALQLDVYVDGVDEIDSDFICLKGKGGAMTAEKLCAEMATTFIAIGASHKQVDRLQAPLPIEVIPWALSKCARELTARGAQVEQRLGIMSDSGLPILDCYGLSYANAYTLDRELSQMTGVVGHGLFALARPHIWVSSNNGQIYFEESNHIT